jgi:hypothetical protein
MKVLLAVADTFFAKMFMKLISKEEKSLTMHAWDFDFEKLIILWIVHFVALVIVIDKIYKHLFWILIHFDDDFLYWDLMSFSKIILFVESEVLISILKLLWIFLRRLMLRLISSLRREMWLAWFVEIVHYDERDSCWRQDTTWTNELLLNVRVLIVVVEILSKNRARLIIISS